MAKDSRTGKSIKNAKIALLYYCINLILQFFSRKIFLEYLGSEVLGLNTTAMNLLQFLNLAELGIGAAIGYSLYKPLACKDRQTVNEIVSVQGYLYRRIGVIILLAAGVLMCFFPRFFEKAHIPLWYAYATFSVLLIDALAGYFFNYRQIVLTADQKNYKLILAVQSIKFVKVILQILAISYFENGYVWWLGLEFCMTIFSVFAINLTLKKEYPWLSSNPSEGKSLRAKYPQIITKTKQLFFHKIASFALFQTSPLIIYSYATLTLVAIYGNYMLIVTGVLMLINAIFNRINAGVGNLVAEGDKTRILRVFNELFSSRFLMAATISFGVYTLADPFISLWVGEQYLLDRTSLILMVCILYINASRSTVDSYINAYGLFHDIWAPIAEASLNLGLSILFGYFWGLHGILCGVLISLVLIIFVWKPYFLFSRGMKEPVIKYITLYSKHIIAAAVIAVLMLAVLPRISIDPNASYLNLVLYGGIIVSLFFILLAILLYISEQGMKDFTARISNVIRKKI